MQQEIFKTVPNYENYKVSNLGNVKSKYIKWRILKPMLNSSGYLSVDLHKNGKRKRVKIHQLVAIVFLNHAPNGYIGLIVDHINNEKLDNRLENLQLTTARVNSSKDRKGGTSKYVGVCFRKKEKKWVSRIYMDGKYKNLGSYKIEYDAHLAYQNELKK